MSDAEEEDARDAWFRREILPLEPVLRAHIRRTAGPRFDAEDLLQETLVRAITAANWRSVAEPAAFLKTVVRNLITDQLRRAKVVAIDAIPDAELSAYADDAPSPEAAVSAREELNRLAAIVASFPQQARRVFTLRKVYDLPVREIAVRLGLSVSTVEKHLAKGVSLCAEAWAREPSQLSSRHENSAKCAGADRRRGGLMGRASFRGRRR